MPEPKRATEQKAGCDVAGCGAEAVRSLSAKRVTESGLKLASDDLRKAGLCREHYKEFKKKTKKDRTYERLGW